MVNDSGYTHFHGPEVNTRAVVSQKVRLFGFAATEEQKGTADAAGSLQQIGVLNSFGVNESRNIEPVFGIGFGDRIAEVVPGVTQPTTISANRIALWLSNIFQVFGYKSGIEGIVRSLRHHKWPFDIRQELIFSQINKAPEIETQASGTREEKDSEASGQPGIPDDATETPGRMMITYYEGCWMNSFSVQFNSQQAVVAEDVGITVSDVTASQTPDLEAYFTDDSNEDKAYRVKPT